MSRKGTGTGGSARVTSMPKVPTGPATPGVADPYIYRYLVTRSEVPTVPVGTLLSDKRRELTHTWEIMDLESGVITSFTGQRVGERLCPTCYRTRKRGTLYGHPEPHDSAPVDASLAVSA